MALGGKCRADDLATHGPMRPGSEGLLVPSVRTIEDNGLRTLRRTYRHPNRELSVITISLREGIDPTRTPLVRKPSNKQITASR